MADKRTICLQRSNNWYHFVNWPDTRKRLAFNANAGTVCVRMVAYTMATLVNLG